MTSDDDSQPLNNYTGEPGYEARRALYQRIADASIAKEEKLIAAKAARFAADEAERKARAAAGIKEPPLPHEHRTIRGIVRGRPLW